MKTVLIFALVIAAHQIGAQTPGSCEQTDPPGPQDGCVNACGDAPATCNLGTDPMTCSCCPTTVSESCTSVTEPTDSCGSGCQEGETGWSCTVSGYPTFCGCFCTGGGTTSTTNNGTLHYH